VISAPPFPQSFALYKRAWQKAIRSNWYFTGEDTVFVSRRLHLLELKRQNRKGLSRIFKSGGNFFLDYRGLIAFDNFAVPVDRNFLFWDPLKKSVRRRRRGRRSPAKTKINFIFFRKMAGVQYFTSAQPCARRRPRPLRKIPFIDRHFCDAQFLI